MSGHHRLGGRVAILEERLEHAGIGQRRRVAKVRLAARDLTQHAAHNLARPRLGQAWRVLHVLGRGECANLAAHCICVDVNVLLVSIF